MVKVKNLKEWVVRNVQAGEYILITGASSGIGHQYLCAFVKAGCNCIATSNDENELAKVVSDLPISRNQNVKVFVADLTQEEGVSSLTAFCKTTSIVALVNNAGFGIKGEFLASDSRRYRDLIFLNAIAPTLLCRSILPGMVEQNRGLLIHVASINACVPIGYNAVYTATKVFLLYYAYAVRYELRNTAIISQIVLPGTTNTPFHVRQGVSPKSMCMQPEEVVKRSLNRLSSPLCISNKLDSLIWPIIWALPFWVKIRIGTALLKKRLGPRSSQ